MAWYLQKWNGSTLWGVRLGTPSVSATPGCDRKRVESSWSSRVRIWWTLNTMLHKFERIRDETPAMAVKIKLRKMSWPRLIFTAIAGVSDPYSSLLYLLFCFTTWGVFLCVKLHFYGVLQSITRAWLRFNTLGHQASFDGLLQGIWLQDDYAYHSAVDGTVCCDWSRLPLLFQILIISVEKHVTFVWLDLALAPMCRPSHCSSWEKASPSGGLPPQLIRPTGVPAEQERRVSPTRWHSTFRQWRSKSPPRRTLLCVYPTAQAPTTALCSNRSSSMRRTSPCFACECRPVVTTTLNTWGNGCDCATTLRQSSWSGGPNSQSQITHTSRVGQSYFKD